MNTYETELIEQVKQGKTVVASLFNFSNPYRGEFLQYVKNLGIGVKIDRSTIWGNPCKDGTIDQNVSGYESYLLGNQKLLAKLPELKGKVLLCWCKKPNKHIKGEAKDQPCHGDILAKYANKN